jgi:anhydro-N-acetylmuramic acid kinase
VSELYIGLMSGTSMDGIDAVLVDLQREPQVLKARTLPWSCTLRERLLAAARGSPLSADQFAQLHVAAGEAFAAAALQISAGHDPATIRAVGSHGQTLAHNPSAQPGYSLQVGAAASIAEATGIITVSDFRSRDIAAGGQGAPLVPAFHQALLRSDAEERVVLNIGGIANITYLPGDAGQPAIGFDTGPGNCLMDAWIRQQTGQDFDHAGAFAARGATDKALLDALLADPYFQAAAPKSTGTDYFSPGWLAQHLSGRAVAAADVQATLLELTARSIANAIDAHAPHAARVLVCGGGSHNPVLMQALQQLLDCPVENTSAYGLDPDWVEAVAFAWLARQTLRHQPGNLPAVTGAAGPRILGSIHPA